VIAFGFACAAKRCGKRGANLQYLSHRTSDTALAYQPRAEEWADYVSASS